MKTGQVALIIINVALIGIIFYLVRYPNTHVMIVQEPSVDTTPTPPPPPVDTRPPEYRSPPIKSYKPRDFQQMGVMTGENGEIMPIYGRESRTRRDRYHYHTVSAGDQLYPLPLTVDGRRCDEDMGCQELYGGEKITALGVPGTFNAEIYRTQNFIDRY